MHHERDGVAAKSRRKPIRLSAVLNALPVLRGLVTERDMCELICDEAPQIGAPIFLTIHGTWAKNKAWTRVDSALLAGFRTAWPEAGFYRFNWSGVNGARHRLEAAKLLACELDKLSLSYPSSQVIALSHSHGGNVLAWASTSIARSLSAAIYLNTPFIQVLETADKSRWSLRVLSFLVSVLALAAIPMVAEFQGVDHLGPYLMLSIGLLFPVTLCVAKLVPVPIRKLSEDLAAISTARRNISRELVVNAVGDEAAAGLGGIYAMQWLLHKAISILGFAVLASIITAPRLFIALLSLIFVFVTILAMLSISSYGFLQGLVALDSRVAVSPSPVGLAETMTVCWEHEFQFHHSELHDAEEVGGAIRSWLCVNGSMTREYLLDQ